MSVECEDGCDYFAADEIVIDQQNLRQFVLFTYA
jgi:hypothetical protein